jgi:hypothetical protein
MPALEVAGLRVEDRLAGISNCVITYNCKGVFSLRIWPLGGENARIGV